MPRNRHRFNLSNSFFMQLSVRYTFLFLLIAFGLLLVVPGCKDASNDDDTSANLVSKYDYRSVHVWNELIMEIDRYAEGYRPGPISRAHGYIGFAAYEACISGMPDYNSLAYLYPNLSIPQADENADYHWPTVVTAVHAYLMTRFFPNVAQQYFSKIGTLENQLYAQYRQETSEEIFNRSKAHGQAVAESVWNWSATDAATHDQYLNPGQDYDWSTNYDGDFDWKPTFPGPGFGMFPKWGEGRTFAISENDKLARPPLAYSISPQSALYAQALEVYAQNTPSLSYENEWVGEFWSDDLLELTFAPPSRFLAIGDQVLVAENSDLATALEMSAKLGMATNDAGVACWFSKYYYNIERPQTYINRVIDPTWKPSLYNPLTGEEGLTPSFPAYPSGHATFGAASAEVLASVFGYSYAMTDHCHENRSEFEGTPRSFGSFYEMAQENAWSRVPLGVHFRMDSEEGMRHGTAIGRKVNALPWKR